MTSLYNLFQKLLKEALSDVHNEAKSVVNDVGNVIVVRVDDCRKHRAGYETAWSLLKTP